MSREIRPVLDRVVVEVHDMETKAAGGLLEIPPIAQDKPQTGTVIAVGPDVDGIKAGDDVVFQRKAGTIVKLDGRELSIMRLEQVYAAI